MEESDPQGRHHRAREVLRQSVIRLRHHPEAADRHAGRHHPHHRPARRRLGSRTARAKWEAEQREVDDEPAAPTLSSVWRELIIESAEAWSPQHLGTHRRVRDDCDLRDLGEGRILGDIPLSALTRFDVAAYLNSYAVEPVRGGELPTRLAIVSRLKVIRTAINYAIDTGRLAGDPTRKLKVPKGRFVEQRDITDMLELDRILADACARLTPSERYLDLGDRAVFMPLLTTVALWGGFRRSELLGLRFRDVEYLDDGWAIVKVRRAVVTGTKAEGGYRIKETKNEQLRDVPLPPVAAQVIGDRRLKLEQQLIADDVTVADIADCFVFSATFGAHPLRPGSVRSWWDALRKIEPRLRPVKWKDQRASHSRKVNRAVGNRGIVAGHMGHGEDVNREHYDGRESGDLDVVRDALRGLLDD